MKYTINGEECTQLQKIQHKLKQLNEARDLMEEFSDRCAWADDFAEYSSIREAIDDVYTASERARDDLEAEIESIEAQLEEAEHMKNEAIADVEDEIHNTLRHCLA